MKQRVASVASIATIALLACAQQTQPAPTSDDGLVAIGRTYINPGPGTALETTFQNPYHGNALAANQGRRLYIWYNCGGCHGTEGGGGMGPPLRDSAWIYGGDPVSIYESIVEGRPKGMPTWYGRIPDDDVWKIVAYIESLAEAPPQQGATPTPTQ